MNKKREHDKTTRLEDFEINRITNFIDKENCLLLTSGIVQLYLSNENEKWSKFATGLVCLIKNYVAKKYTINLVDLSPKILWKDDINMDINYTRLTEHFHYFSTAKGFVGLNFSFDDEANRFHKSIKKTMLKLNKTFKPPASEPYTNITLKVPNQNQSTLSENNSTTVNTSDTSLKSMHSFSFIDIKKKAEKKKINKFTIGNPIQNSFVHLNHIGLSEDNSFDIKMHEKDENISTMIMDVLQQLNIKPTKHSLNYAKNFIESNGGFQQYFKEYKKKKMAPIANAENENLESSSISDKLSPINKSNIDERKQKNYSLTPTNSLKAPSRPPPKPPAPKRNLLDVKMESTFITSPNSETNLSFISPISNLNQSDISQTKSTGAPSFSISPPVILPSLTPQSQTVPSISLQSSQPSLPPPLPPPPPPPPFPTQSLAPPLPCSLPSSGSDLNISNSSNFSSSSVDNRSALLKSIENFKGGLKHVDRNTSKSSLGSNSNIGGNSDNNNNHTNNNNDLFNQLYNALNNMRQYLSSSSDESSDSDDSFEIS